MVLHDSLWTCNSESTILRWKFPVICEDYPASACCCISVWVPNMIHKEQKPLRSQNSIFSLRSYSPSKAGEWRECSRTSRSSVIDGYRVLIILSFGFSLRFIFWKRLQASAWKIQPPKLSPAAGAAVRALPKTWKGWVTLQISPLTMMRKGSGAPTLSRAFRKPWLSIHHAGGGKSSYQTKARCMVSDSNAPGKCCNPLLWLRDDHN